MRKHLPFTFGTLSCMKDWSEIIHRYQAKDYNTVCDFLNSELWPFHSKIMNGEIGEQADSRIFLAVTADEVIGYIKITDFVDGDTPLFDVRVSETQRGKGLGAVLIKVATDAVFTELKQTIRFEAVTRIDNLPMQNLFKTLGWTQESHYRKGWRNSDGSYLDSLGFSILREEWEQSKKYE